MIYPKSTIIEFPGNLFKIVREMSEKFYQECCYIMIFDLKKN